MIAIIKVRHLSYIFSAYYEWRYLETIFFPLQQYNSHILVGLIPDLALKPD